MSHHVASLSPEIVPVALPPMASIFGKAWAVSFIASKILSQWYCGSGLVTSHSVSFVASTSLSLTATVLMSLFPRSNARRHPFASEPQTWGVSLSNGRSLGLATMKTSNGVSGWPQTLGMVRTSNLYLPCGEKAFCRSPQMCCGPQSTSLWALRCQSMPWMSTPARWTDASKNLWCSGKTGMKPRPTPSERISAHSRKSLQLLAAE
mmetsp:Transcript_84300/g.247269  ORF Transcript_84300/g.247269 Transcript_84300/m.247269 type:complete len:206 (+) Transcript_84300:831-1448(+)